MQTGNIYYAKHEGLLVLKLVGEIRYTMGESYRISASLDSFLERLFAEKDFENVLIDLTETESIDSTNLGLLAKVAQFTDREFGRRATIVSTNADINTILESVGFDQVFLIIHDPQDPSVELESLPEVREPEKDLALLLLDAHKALIELSEKNREMFRNVVQLLEKRISDPH